MDYKEKTTEELLDLLPPRYINHPFDELYVMSIFKSNGLWYIRYANQSNSKSFNQQSGFDIRLAAI